MAFDQALIFKALADDTRLRIIRLLFKEELNVFEVGRILDIPQPSVSRHLSALKTAGLVTDRREGTRSYYSLVDHPEGVNSLEAVLREIAETDHADLQRLEDVVAARSQASRSLMDEKADYWDEIVGSLHSSSASLLAMANMVPRGLAIGDLGTGTGLLLPVLSAMADRVHAVDQSAAMLRRARKRCREAGLENVSFHTVDLNDLPGGIPPCDGLFMHFVMHQIPRPGHLLNRIPTILKPGGRLIIVDRCEHEDERAKDRFGSIWLGFAREKVEQWIKDAGLDLQFWEEVPGKSGQDNSPKTFVCAAEKT